MLSLGAVEDALGPIDTVTEVVLSIGVVEDTLASVDMATGVAKSSLGFRVTALLVFLPPLETCLLDFL